MKPNTEPIKKIVAKIDAEIRALPVQNAPNMRVVRRKYSAKFRLVEPGFILSLARELLNNYNRRWFAYELIQGHKAASKCLRKPELEELGKGIDSWWTVDSFARTLSGPAWLQGQIADQLILKWARSKDRWWRRAALVSTVALNLRSQGGYGDVRRTLNICRVLAADHDDMVFKALSWALRQLAVHDPNAVRKFLKKYDDVLAARVKYEVNNKLRTGLKTPKRRI